MNKVLSALEYDFEHNLVNAKNIFKSNEYIPPTFLKAIKDELDEARLCGSCDHYCFDEDGEAYCDVNPKCRNYLINNGSKGCNHWITAYYNEGIIK